MHHIASTPTSMLISTATVVLLLGPSAADEYDVTSQWQRHTIEDDLAIHGMAGFGAADISGDGKPDLLACLGARNKPKPQDGVYWYEIPSDPKAGPWVRRRLSDPSEPIRWSMALATGDVDKDGDLDVVALSFDNGYVYLCLNPLGQGGNVRQPWRTLKIWGAGGVARDGERVELTDVDGDGFPDVVFPRGRPVEAHVLFNPSGKASDRWRHKTVGTIAGTDAHDVYTADLDGDGDLDIVSASGDGGGPGLGSGKVFWFRHPDGNPREGVWSRYRIDSHSACWGGLKVEDVDGDGRPDVIASESHAHPGKTYWFRNPGAAKNQAPWPRSTIGSQTYPHVNTLIDVDGDGVNELWVPDCSFKKSAQFAWRSGGLVYFKRNEDPMQPWGKYRVAEAPEVGRPCLTLDVDRDGDLDVVCGANLAGDTGSFVWWENRRP